MRARPGSDGQGSDARIVRELRPAIDRMREYLEAPPEERAAGAHDAPRLLLEGAADGDVGPVSAAALVSRQLERPLFRLDLRLMHEPGAVAPSIAALLTAAANVGAVTLLEEMDVLVPAADADRWLAQLTALAVRGALRAHPLPVIVGATSADGLHPVVAREIDHTVSLTTGGMLDDR